MQNRMWPLLTLGIVAVLSSCSESSSKTTSPGTGGTATSTGGVRTGGTTTGGAASTGGTVAKPDTGGVIATGGVRTGGVSAQGGTGGGGVATGGTATGGTSTGGTTTTGGVARTGGSTGGVQSTGGSIPDASVDLPAKDATPSGGTGGQSTNDAGISTGGTTGVSGPCDIYQAGNNPCVAAHSTTRALYGAYAGKLYQLRRTDKTVKDIGVVAPGGIADVASQDAFCAGSKCTISIIYDQSPQGNHLTKTSGGWIGDRAKEADAYGVKVTMNGKTVYGVHVPLSTDRATGVGYRNNVTKGIAKGDEPESMYMVANGKLYSNECCFDYGNATTNSLNKGPGTMEAIYFGNCTTWGSGDGKGPWVMADLEEGLFSGKGAKLNAANKTVTYDYVTAMLKGKPGTFAIKVGDSQTGTLAAMYEGARPSPSSLGSYDPMKKEGGVILGTGGDNSFMGAGDFFEGAMTTGYATDATDAAIQANIIAAGYGK